MDPDEDDTAGNDGRADERDKHRAAPSGRLVRLALFDDIDQPEVEVLADRGGRGLGRIGLRGYPLVGGMSTNARIDSDKASYAVYMFAKHVSPPTEGNWTARRREPIGGSARNVLSLCHTSAPSPFGFT